MSHPQRLHHLTAAQHGIWNAQQLDPTSPYYVVGEVLELEAGTGTGTGTGTGKVDTALLADAVRLTVDEAETLRLRFTDTPDGPRQYVDSSPATAPEIRDLSTSPDPRLTAAAVIDAEKADCGEQWRTMTDGPLFRYLILDLGTAVWCIQLYHHIIVDGYSAALLTRRTAAHYTELCGGRPARRNRFATIAEIVEVDQAYRSGDGHAADRDFWRDTLTPAPDTTGREDLVHGAGTASITTTLRLEPDEVARVKSRAEAHGLVWSDLVTAAYAAWLRKFGFTGDGDEALIAMPMMARTSGPLRRTPAMLVNMLPLRFPVDADATVTDLAVTARAALDAARVHQCYPGSELARDLGTPAALHGIGLNLKTFDFTLDFHGTTGVLRNVAGGPPEDLVLVVTPAAGSDGSDGAIDLAFETDPRSVSAATARQRLRDIRALLGSDGPLREIRLRSTGFTDATARERAGAPLPASPATLDELIDGLAVGTGRLVDGDGGGGAADLHTRIGDLAGQLPALSAEYDVIAVDLPKGVHLATALLAIWRAHRAFVVLDREHPQARRDRILADSGAVAVLDDDGFRPVVTDGATASPVPDLAYLLYTSGTTGAPKGVQVTRGAVEALLAGHRTSLYPDAWSRARETAALHVAHTASFSFDAAIDQLSWVFTGATVHLYDTGTVGDPAAMRAALASDTVDVLDATPSLAGALIDSGALDESGVSTVILGGEAVPRPLWNRLAEMSDTGRFGAWNIYGPTETTVDALATRVTRGPVTIGRAVPGMTAEILDVDGEVVPDNETGELFVSGPQVALGYHGQPDRTADVFDTVEDRRRYRTGDLVRWVPDASGGGAHHFLGRADDQLEIRGHRVEPAEVEAALLSLPQVTGAAVGTFGDPGSLKLIAHVTTDGRSGHSDPASVRTDMAATVPGHLVPTRVIVHDRLPLTVGGKVDRRALEEMTVVDDASAPTGTARHPRTDAERLLGEVVSDLLGTSGTDLDRDFISLGGDSIGALTVAGQLRRRGLSIQAKDLLTGVELADVAAGAERVHPLRTPGGGTTGQKALPDRNVDSATGGGRYPTGAIPAGVVDGPRPALVGNVQPPDLPTHELHARIRAAITAMTTTHGALRAVLDESESDAPRFIVPRVPLVDPDALIAPGTLTDTELVDSLDPASGIVWRLTAPGDDGRVRVAVDRDVTEGTSTTLLLDDLGTALAGHPLDTPATSWREQAGTTRPAASVTVPVTTSTAPVPDAPALFSLLSSLFSATTEEVAVAAALLAVGGPVDLVTGPGSTVRRIPALPDDRTATARTALSHAKEHRRADTGTTAPTTPPQVTVTCGDTRMVPVGHAAQVPGLLVGKQDMVLSGGAGTSPGVYLDAFAALAVLARTSDGGATPSDLHVPDVPQKDIDRWERTHGPLSDVLPVAPLQDGLLYHSVSGGDGYVLAAGVDLRGPVDAGRLHQAFIDVLGRHDLLRARFDSGTLDSAVQLIPRTVDLPWRTVDLRGIPRTTAVDAADRIMEDAAARTIDVERGPLVTATLVLLPPGTADSPTARLVLGNHHLLTDGWSTPVMLRDLLAIYHGDPLPHAAPYSDYLDWLAARDPHASDDAWNERLDGLDHGTLVRDLAPATADDIVRAGTVTGEVVTDVIPDTGTGAGIGTGDTVLSRARRAGVTANTLLQAAWTLTLAALTGDDDIVFGTTVSGRPTEIEGIEHTVGLFINTLPARVTLHRDDSLSTLVTGIGRTQAEMTAHHSTPLVHVEKLAGVGSLFDTLVVYDNFPALDADEGAEGSGRITVAEVHTGGMTDFPLSLVVPPGDRPRIVLAHRPDLVDARFVDLARRTLAQVLATVETGLDGDLAAARTTVGDVLDALPGPWIPASVGQTTPTHDPGPAVGSTVVPEPSGSPLAETIAGVMATLLDLDHVGTNDNFFDIGGHSLLAMRLLGRLRRTGTDGLDTVTIKDIVETGSPAALAARLGGCTPGPDPTASVLPLAAGDGDPLFCVHPGGGLALPFRGLADHLGDLDIPVTGLQLPQPHPTADSLTTLAAGYVDTVQELRPHGPYRLLGYSFGGVVAQAMAAELLHRGEQVSYLGILDAYPAGTGPMAATPAPDGLGGLDGRPCELDAEVLAAMAGTDSTEDAAGLADNLAYCDRLMRDAAPVDLDDFTGTAQIFVATRADERVADLNPGMHWDPAPEWRSALRHEPEIRRLDTTHAAIAAETGWGTVAPAVAKALTAEKETLS